MFICVCVRVTLYITHHVVTKMLRIPLSNIFPTDSKQSSLCVFGHFLPICPLSIQGKRERDKKGYTCWQADISDMSFWHWSRWDKMWNHLRERLKWDRKRISNPNTLVHITHIFLRINIAHSSSPSNASHHHSLPSSTCPKSYVVSGVFLQKKTYAPLRTEKVK